MSTVFPYVWFWRCRHPERKGQSCQVEVRGRMNSVLVVFPDGLRVVTSRYAVRRAMPAPPLPGGTEGET